MRNKEIKITIITICYNSEDTIERTIKSVLWQTKDCYEYIIIDGASNDKTLAIIKKYESSFNGRLKLYSEPDKGIYDAMNKGIIKASGDIIGIVNSDDWLEPTAIESVIESFEDNGSSLDSIYCGWLNFHYENGDIQILKTDHRQLQAKSSSFIMAGIRHPAVFVPKIVYESFGLFDIRMKILADTDLILRLFFQGVNFKYINKVITNMSDGGISNKRYISSTRDYVLILKKFKIPYTSEKLLILKYFSKMVIKSILPVKMLKFYRQR